MKCPCGSVEKFDQCCQPYIQGRVEAESPERLMRSRYSAFATKEFDYLEATLDPQTRDSFDHESNRKWAMDANFTKLEILSSSQDGNKGFVDFKASYTIDEEKHVHHEHSRFRRMMGRWYFRDGRIVQD